VIALQEVLEDLLQEIGLPAPTASELGFPDPGSAPWPVNRPLCPHPGIQAGTAMPGALEARRRDDTCRGSP
jgi:hypothetical protein